MATLLGIEIGTRSVRAALVRTQLRKTIVSRYIEVSFDDVRAMAARPSAPAPLAPSEPNGATPAANGAPAATPAWDPIAPIGGLSLGNLNEAAGFPPPVPPPAQPTPIVEAPPIEIDDRTAIRLAVLEVVRRAGVTSPTMIADLPGEDVSLRRIDLPPAALKKIDELLPFEMESLIPFDAAETLLDHQIAATLEPTKLRIVVCAVPRTKVRERLAFLESAGVDPEELVPGPAALGGLVVAMPALANEGPHVIVNVGARRTDVAVIRQGKLELARTISAGADDVREAGFQEAPFGSGAERLARELKQTLASHRMQGGSEPESIRIAGEIDPGTPLEGWLANALGRAPVLLELPEAPETDLTMPIPPHRRAAFAMPLGLALHSRLPLKHLDLRRGEFVRKRSMGAIRELAPLLGVCAAFITVAYFYSVYAHWSVLTARREVLESQLAEITDARLGEETRSVTRARSLLESGRQRPDPLPAFDAFDAMLALSAAIPDGIDHDLQRLQIDLGDDRSGGHLELQATVTSIEERDRIAEALGEVACFREIELGPMTAAGEGRRQYRLELAIQCPGTADEEEESGHGHRRRRSGAASATKGAP
jgi:general secretion pathway protein L